MNPQLKYRTLWLSIGYTILLSIIYLSVTSQPVDVGVEFPFQDKFFHALAYFVLMFWFVQIYHERKQVWIFAMLFFVVGISMEIIQSFDPARYAEFEDMIANTTGIVIALFCSRFGWDGLLLRMEKVFRA